MTMMHSCGKSAAVRSAILILSSLALAASASAQIALPVIAPASKPVAAISTAPAVPVAVSGKIAGAVKPPLAIAPAASHDLESITSELSPAVMYRSQRNSLTLLRDLPKAFGLGGPTHVASMQGGKVVVQAVQGPTKVATPGESWLLVWFAGGAGWDKVEYAGLVKKMFPPEAIQPIPAMDIPVLVVLQKKPTDITISPDGLELTFAGPTGWVSFMPLYGVKALLASESAGWEKDLPAPVLAQAHRWNSYLKQFPVDMGEYYSVDIAKDAVTVTQEFRWLAVPDEWNTPAVKAAPQPPMIALAKEDGYSVSFLPAAADTGLATRFGPLYVSEGVDVNQYVVTGMLKYINEWPVYTGTPKKADPVFDQMKKALLARLPKDIEVLRKKKMTSFNTGASAASLLLAAPFVDPVTAKTLQDTARKVIGATIFNISNYQGADPSKARDFTLKSGRRWIGAKEGWSGDVEPLSFFALQAVGAYCQATGDWSVLKENSAYTVFLKPIAVQKVKHHNWLIQGRENSGGDSFHNLIQGICLMPRLAAKMNDADEYAENAYIFAKFMANYQCFTRGSLKYARRFPIWATPLMPKAGDGSDRDTVVWDYYIHHGPNFTYVGQRGFYGDWTGYYEHISRSNMPGTFLDRYWKDHLQDRAVELFDRKDAKQFDTFKVALVNMFLAKVLEWPLNRLHPNYTVDHGAGVDALITTLEAGSTFKMQSLWSDSAGRPTEAFAKSVANWREGLQKDIDADGFQWINVFHSQRSEAYPYPFPFVFGWNNPKPMDKSLSPHMEHCMGLGFVWPKDAKPMTFDQEQRLGWLTMLHVCDGN